MDMLDSLVAQGADHADVMIPVLGDPEERAAAIQALADLLDEVDAYCEAGDQLLTIVTPPDLREFRTWLFAQVIGQLRGAAPAPWIGRPGARTPQHPSTASRADGEPLVVRESGALDLGDAARVREALQSAFTASDADVTVDLTEVEFVDSVILSVFVTAHKRFATGDRTLTFLVPPDLLRVFELTGLVGVLDVRAVEARRPRRSSPAPTSPPTAAPSSCAPTATCSRSHEASAAPSPPPSDDRPARHRRSMNRKAKPSDSPRTARATSRSARGSVPRCTASPCAHPSRLKCDSAACRGCAVWTTSLESHREQNQPASAS